MKRKLRIPALAAIAIAVLLSFGLGVAAGTLTVGTGQQFTTIEAALAAAGAGDIIEVGAGAGYTLPIQIQVDGVIVKAAGVGDIVGTDSSAVFVVGAAWTFDLATSTYSPRRVSGVTIEGFTIKGGDIGVLIKEADDVTVRGNIIGGTTYEGIRLLDASGCTIDNNTINVAAAGIGIFLQNSGTNASVDGATKNTLTGNTVTNSGLGLFIFESNGNEVTGDTYNSNGNGGVVLNDSEGNTLENLTVQMNTGWGARFVFSDGNSLLTSRIEDNTVGGVELLGSQDNLVEGCIVFNNGTAGDGSDDAQIVITKGDKEIFTTDVFTQYNTLGDLSEFVDEKFIIYEKLDLLWWWVDELDSEFWDIRQKTATAIGMCEQQQTPPSTIVDYIDKIIYEKHFIDSPQTASETGGEGVLRREFFDRDPNHRPAAMENTVKNFTLANFTNSLTEDLDFYDDGTVNDFNLDRDGVNDTFGDADDEISWDKLWILDIIVWAIRHEIWNPWNPTGTPDSLKEKLDDLLDKGLILESDKLDLEEKLDAALGFLAQIEVVKHAIRDKLDDDDDCQVNSVDEYLEAAKTALATAEYATAKGLLLAAKDLIDDAIFEKQEIYDLIWDIRFKLCLVDLELPPFPEVNSDLVGKKEKPFIDITTEDVTGMKTAIVGGLNGDDNAKAIRKAVTKSETWGAGDITTHGYTTKCSTGNTIASNLISSHLDRSNDRQIGIVIECPDNTIVNNVITNEKVLPIDTATGYSEFHRLDIAIILLASDCTIAYNTIEWVDVGIIRGGTWKRDDVQLEYVFEKLAAAAYWPEPGFSRTGCDDPNTSANDPTTYTKDHFVRRTVAWVPVLSVTSREVANIGFATSQRVKGNRIALNFFEYIGTSIDIIDAESNVIDENLFYNCSNGILFRAPLVTHPWYPDIPTGGAGSNIVLEKNDYYSGVAIHNDSDLAVDANRDYTPPQGTVGHATVFGLVNPPAAPAPNSYDNFGTNVKYVILVIEKYAPDYDSDIILPPNLSFFYDGVVLPEEKPRHPSAIFDIPQPSCLSETFPASWNMVSIPVYALDDDPDAVFGDDTPLLYMFEYDGAGYLRYDPPAHTFDILPTGGYWIWLIDETTLDVCGTVPTQNVTFGPLGDPGWYMISTPTVAVYLSHVEVTFDGGVPVPWETAVANEWVDPFAFWWNPISGEYELIVPDEDGVLRPWFGYWIKTNEAGVEITLPIVFSLENPPDVPPWPPASLSPKAVDIMPKDMPPPPPPPPSAETGGELVVMNVPNPVRDVDTTTFRVMGAMVEAIRVRIFDLSGRLVYEEETPGWELTWHIQNLAGEYLANGVYLYRVEAKVGGQWVLTEVKKLAIYR